MTDIGELVVRIKADAAGVQEGMTRATGIVRQQAGQMESAVGSLKEQFRELIPALTVAAVVAFGHSAIEAADRLNDLAMRTGFAGSTLSALNIPLKQSGSSVDEFAASINRMNNLVGEAAKGTNQEAVKAFDALGLSVRKLQQLSPEQQFFEIAAALGQMDNQSQMTNAGMAIFGRSFASLIPLIKEAGGNLKDFTDKAKANGDALTDEQLKKIDEWGDRWTNTVEHAKLAVIDYLDYFYKLGEAHRKFFDDMGLPANASHSAGRTLSDEEAAKSVRDSMKAKGLAVPAEASAKGSNAGLLTPPKDSALKEYIANLRQETAAVGQNERALFVARAEIEATAKAKADFNDKLRSSKELLPDEKANVDSLAGSYYDLKKAQEENARVAKLMQDAIADSLADIAVNFDNLEDTATSAIQAIAKEIIKSQITQPLAQSIVGSVSGGASGGGFLSSFSSLGSIGSLFTGLGFADGGSPPVGRASIVGENGPELFVPNTAGTVVPNGKMGGTTVVVNQTFALNPGATEQTVAQLRTLVPTISDATYNRVFQALRNGGSESQIAGLRS